MSEQPTDSAAQTATEPAPQPAPAASVLDEQPPPTEGARELRETVRSISRLEESN